MAMKAPIPVPVLSEESSVVIEPDTESQDDEIDLYERQLENTLLQLKLVKTLIDAKKCSYQADESDSESEF